ncbi:chemotaxis response regulator protein-glutamate methylesterase [Pseudooceanicola sediminis]|uniref:Protein-glutamate methylesterase/protein-glutamine glutaminase n=1 Tax=Pseudooceanicola sediminis TaxID=2211117 RepID=A0A399J0F5_9RHOB|nr:chemotaxis response regulator protein-glutamate methylesterase [Pseudooceanicola sediminis]KAA2311399.1 chemotaxis response regulator protein-glutamate methylesterase [Puniceibacterium sp. HSS470]RII38019.1 chemotaxis response regulator protein-glutamate methylesterase [Pseudooceanicola sediminis]|tara:strand:+ start:16373 stop:17488 length:1116 start_codon:yes stop_codon:yes gene_type:complete
MNRIRVLIVDDSASARRALTEILSEDPGINVLASAADAFDAAAKMRAELPDVILLDLELPRMDGLTFLAKIMAQRPIPVVICSSHTEAGSQAAMKALEIGACEVIGKPRMSSRETRMEAQILLTDAVRAAAHAGRMRGYTSQARAMPVAPPVPFTPSPKLTADAILPAPRKGVIMPPDLPVIVAVGASTGGTEALAQVLPKLDRSTPPVVIVQHMPEKFTAAFANRLNGLCACDVREAANGDRPERGLVLIAPGDSHMIVKRQGKGYRVEVMRGPQVSRHRPSVDVLFRSVAIAAGAVATGILMTGMGDDGAQGLLEMRDAGADTLIQDEASSIVWGMPGEASRLGASDRAVPLGRISAEIQNAGRKVRRL